MRLTRRHFNELARLFGRAIAGYNTDALLDELVDFLKTSNPKFDEDRFIGVVLDEAEFVRDNKLNFDRRKPAVIT